MKGLLRASLIGFMLLGFAAGVLADGGDGLPKLPTMPSCLPCKPPQSILR
jgi:hypothetical protein